MFLDRYDVEVGSEMTIFEFVSKGKRGDITKVVRFDKTNLKDFYNLGFGDKDEVSGQIDDKVITDNGDSEKVLATIAATVYGFTGRFPKAWVYLTGTNLARTRLYRIGIGKYLDKIKTDFDVYGLVEKNRWKSFERNQNYKAFLIKRKA